MSQADNEYLLQLTQTIKDESTPHGTGKSHARLTTTTDDRQESADQYGTAPVITKKPLNPHHHHSNHQRYQLDTLLGSGGGGFVYSADDQNLKRTVAIKFLHPDNLKEKKYVDKFIREATLTSILEHPNIPPIYDLDSEYGQQLYYSMKKINGQSLNECIKEGLFIKQNRIDVSRIVSIFIEALQALAFAHYHGIIHRDIKPENIMIGELGEVYLVDWGIAINRKAGEAPHGKMAGTPVYMSPEQARKEPADERSDIYCLGTTMFHTLFDQIPFETATAETFWEHKRNGRLAEINSRHLISIPAPLVAICMKCLVAEPERRYQSANELLEDLKTFQSGGMVSAYRYSLNETLQYHLKRSSRHLIWLLMLLAVITVSSSSIYDYYKLQVSGWGSPTHTYTFDDDQSWRNDWILLAKTGHISAEQGRAITHDGLEYHWFLGHSFSGSIAIEFESEMLPNGRPGDLSIVYCPDIMDRNARNLPKNMYYLQHAAIDNSCSMIDGPNGRLDYTQEKLSSGRVYTIRGEIDDRHLRLFLDGKLICSYDLLFPLSNGYIGIYSYYDQKAFDNIRVYDKELPQLASITATGDLLYENAQYQLAIDRYEQIRKSHAGTRTADESLYKIGLCHIQMDKTDLAFEVWSQINSPFYRNQINHYRWQELYAKKQYDLLINEIMDAYIDNLAPKQIKNEWATYLNAFCQSGNIAMIDRLLSMRQRLFPHDQTYSNQVLNALHIKGQTNRALVMFPEQESIVTKALLSGGRYNDVIKNYPQQTHAVLEALYRSGQYKKIIKNHSDNKNYAYKALVASGQVEKARNQFSDFAKSEIDILNMNRHQLQEFIDKHPPEDSDWFLAALRLGREEEFLAAAVNSDIVQPNRVFDAEISLALKDHLAGAPLDVISGKLQHIPGDLRTQQSQMFNVYFLFPIMAHFNGHNEILRAHQNHIQDNLKDMHGKRLWYCSKLLDGSLSKYAFMTQPTKLYIDQDYNLFQGLHHDIHGRKKLALEYYQQIEQLPQYKRYYSPTQELFINRRIDRLRQ